MTDKEGHIRLTGSAGQIPLTLNAVFSGKDLCVALAGGNRAHIGAVALAQPRQSLAKSGKLSATASVIALVGHKEGALACRTAEQISKSINGVVTVACGIHVDDIGPSGIKAIEAAVQDMTDRLIQHCQNVHKAG